MVNARTEGDVTPAEVLAAFSPSVVDDLARMRAMPEIYNRLARSICPTVYGHEDVKKVRPHPQISPLEFTPRITIYTPRSHPSRYTLRKPEQTYRSQRTFEERDRRSMWPICPTPLFTATHDHLASKTVTL